MSATLELLKRYKEFKELRSNYAAAKALGISESTISGWVAGGTMDQSTALQIAQEIGIEPLATMAQVQLERPLSPRERRIWGRYCARVFVAALATVAATGVIVQDADATTISRIIPDLTTYTLCVSQAGNMAHGKFLLKSPKPRPNHPRTLAVSMSSTVILRRSSAVWLGVGIRTAKRATRPASVSRVALGLPGP